MENSINYINEGPVKIAVEITPTTIENYSEMFGKRRVIKTCPLKAITRIVKDITLLENKVKLTIYYTENGKEKRFGGVGYGIEGNLSNPKFQEVVAFLETHLPAHTVWEDKAIGKASTKTRSGETKFPIAGSLNLLFYKHPSHSGERTMIIIVRYFLMGVAFFVGLMFLMFLFSEAIHLVGKLVYVLISIPILMYAYKIAKTGFKDGGLYILFLDSRKIKINYVFKSVVINTADIKTIDYTFFNLKIRNLSSMTTTSSMEYEFIINSKHKFTMGENTALPFIAKLEEQNMPISQQ